MRTPPGVEILSPEAHRLLAAVVACRCGAPRRLPAEVRVWRDGGGKPFVREAVVCARCGHRQSVLAFVAEALVESQLWAR